MSGSSSIVLNRIFKTEETELKDMFSKIIDEQMKKAAEELKKVAESKISEDISRFYSGQSDSIEDELFDSKITPGSNGTLPKVEEVQKLKVFSIRFPDGGNPSNYYFSKNYIFTEERGCWSFSKHKIPINVLFGIKSFAGGGGCGQSRVYNLLRCKYLLNNCAEFEVICKQEESERKAMMDTLRQEREEFESEKEQFYTIMTDYTAFQEEKKRFEEEKRKLSLVKMKLESEKKKIEQEREELIRQRLELEQIKSEDIDLDKYFETNSIN
jgi:DNA repair exonuclease SbcCD ATPase subunit